MESIHIDLTFRVHDYVQIQSDYISGSSESAGKVFVIHLIYLVIASHGHLVYRRGDRVHAKWVALCFAWMSKRG